MPDKTGETSPPLSIKANETLGQTSILTKLDTAERLAKIFSLLAIPVVVALGGWWIQRATNLESIRQEYVKQALSILREAPTPEQSILREWAARILSRYSEVPLTQDQIAALTSGKAILPMGTTIYEYDAQGRLIATTGPVGLISIAKPSRNVRSAHAGQIVSEPKTPSPKE